MIVGLYFLQSAGVQFPQRAQVVQSNHPSSQPNRSSNVPNSEQASPRHELVAQQAETQSVPESRWLLFFSFSVLLVDRIFRNPFLAECIENDLFSFCGLNWKWYIMVRRIICFSWGMETDEKIYPNTVVFCQMKWMIRDKFKNPFLGGYYLCIFFFFFG